MTDIPSAAALAPLLIEREGANPEDADLVSGLIIDAALAASARGTPKPMLEHVADAKRGFPMMFAPPITAAPSVPAGETVTARIAREATTTTADPDPWASMPVTRRVMIEAGRR